MPADYKTFQDSAVELVKGGDLDTNIDFDTPDVDTTQPASIAYLITPTGSVTVTMTLNGDTILTQDFNSAFGRTMRENFSGSSLKRHNTLTVSKDDDGEDVTLSDFIVHYKTV